MIILKLKAGLGNQLFQYAYARARALRSKTNLMIDLTWFQNVGPNETKREFTLDKYNIQADILQITKPMNPSVVEKVFKLAHRIIKKLKRIIFKYSDQTYYPKLAEPIKSIGGVIPIVTVEGFWNTEKYFKDFESTIRKELTLKNPLGEEASQIALKLKQYKEQGFTLILLHVRRGDYVTSIGSVKLLGITGLEYYKKAIKTILECVSPISNASTNISSATSSTSDTPIMFVLASDDSTWVKENIPQLLGNTPYEIISGRPTVKDFEELYLMSLCHHFIITNSTYSWWSAWLSESAEIAGVKKIVVGPEKWIVDPKIDTRDVMPKEWIRI